MVTSEDVEPDIEKEVLDAIYAVEATLRHSQEQSVRVGRQGSNFGVGRVRGNGIGGIIPGVGVPLLYAGKAIQHILKGTAGLGYGFFHALACGLFEMGGSASLFLPMFSSLFTSMFVSLPLSLYMSLSLPSSLFLSLFLFFSTFVTMSMSAMRAFASMVGNGFGMGYRMIQGTRLPSFEPHSEEYRPSQFELPGELANSTVALQGAYFGLAAASSIRWISRNSLRITMYTIALLALVLLVSGLYLYNRNYHLYKQTEKEQRLGVVSIDTKTVRKEMETLRGNDDVHAPSVRYVEMTPHNYGHMG